MAKKYGIGPRLLFQWKKDLMPDPRPDPVFAEVKLTDDQATDAVQPGLPPASPVVIERPVPGFEIELRGGRRVRFDRETDPETIRSLVSLLEAGAS